MLGHRLQIIPPVKIAQNRLSRRLWHNSPQIEKYRLRIEIGF